MPHHTTTLTIETRGPGMAEVTHRITEWIAQTGVQTGLLTALCRHTSASLTINENAADAVQRDLVAWLDRTAPQSDRYEHDSEGPDDMPAHLKTTLTGVSLSVPVQGGAMMLGTWQGIFLVEHRARPHSRDIALHLAGD